MCGSLNSIACIVATWTTTAKFRYTKPVLRCMNGQRIRLPARLMVMVMVRVRVRVSVKLNYKVKVKVRFRIKIKVRVRVRVKD